MENRDVVHQSIVFIGPTGVGKSRLVEVLTNGGGLSSDRIASKTRSAKRVDANPRKMREHEPELHVTVVDTIGVGDDDLTVDDIIMETTDCLLGHNITQIWIVLRYGVRLSAATLDNVNKLVAHFQDLNIDPDAMTIVLTHVGDVKEEAVDKYIADVKAACGALEHISQDIRVAIPNLDIMNHREYYEQHVKISCETLREQLLQKPRKISIRPSCHQLNVLWHRTKKRLSRIVPHAKVSLVSVAIYVIATTSRVKPPEGGWSAAAARVSEFFAANLPDIYGLLGGAAGSAV